MKILIYESKNKKERKIVDIAPNILEKLLMTDNGLVEVIPMHNQRDYVRIYFDIDIYDISTDPCGRILDTISEHFKCSIDHWAVASSHRENKLSYHIVSKTKAITIKELRDYTSRLKKIYPCVDTQHLYYTITDRLESGYFRLPNQSKKTLNKHAPPLRIVCGDISDFFITNLNNVELYAGSVA